VTVSSVSPPTLERHKRLTQLIELLLEEGWTQSALASAIGVDFSTIYRWLKGKTIPESDSKNFRQLAKLSGGSTRTLQLYLDGEISLSVYRSGSEEMAAGQASDRKKTGSEKIKKEVLAKIYSLEPDDIADIISSSVAFLAKLV
jgi:transcriptional regulator with XRE-family HTH domain